MSSEKMHPEETEARRLVSIESARDIVSASKDQSREGSIEGEAEALALRENAAAEQHHAEAAEIAVVTQKVMDAYRHVATSAPEAAVPMVKAIESLIAAREAIGTLDFEAPSLSGSPFNTTELGASLLREVSGGSVHYERNQGAVIEEKALENHGEELRVNLENVEATRGHSALSYVSALPKGALDSHVHPVRPSIDSPEDFEVAFTAKEQYNRAAAKNTFLGLGATSTLGFAGTFVAGAVGSAAVASGLLLASGGLGVAALAAYGGKRLYDRHKEEKAIKDYSAAVIAKRVRGTLFN